MGTVVVRDKNVTGSFITLTMTERLKIIASYKLGCMHLNGPNPTEMHTDRHSMDRHCSALQHLDGVGNWRLILLCTLMLLLGR